VATPQEDLDAVNLRSLKEIQHELESVHSMVKALNAIFEKNFEGVKERKRIWRGRIASLS